MSVLTRDQYDHLIKELINGMNIYHKKIDDNNKIMSTDKKTINSLIEKAGGLNYQESIDNNTIFTKKFNIALKNKNTSDLRFTNIKYVYNNEIIFTANLMAGIIICFLTITYTS
jgi:hypothetical protein